MNEILNLTINEMPQTEFDCSCGKHHNFSVHEMSIRKGAIEDLPKMAEPFKDGKILVVFDNHTYEVAGKKAVQLLKENGFNYKELLFDTGDDILIPDEKTLGRIVQEQDLDTSLMIAVGSGVLNDSVKFVTSRSGLPYIIIATAPSMDGYVFEGWCTAETNDASCSGNVYRADETYMISAVGSSVTVNLYAMWKNNGGGSPVEEYIMQEVADWKGDL